MTDGPHATEVERALGQEAGNGLARGNRATGKVLGRGERVKEKALFIF